MQEKYSNMEFNSYQLHPALGNYNSNYETMWTMWTIATRVTTVTIVTTAKMAKTAMASMKMQLVQFQRSEGPRLILLFCSPHKANCHIHTSTGLLTEL